MVLSHHDFGEGEDQRSFWKLISSSWKWWSFNDCYRLTSCVWLKDGKLWGLQQFSCCWPRKGEFKYFWYVLFQLLTFLLQIIIPSWSRGINEIERIAGLRVLHPFQVDIHLHCSRCCVLDHVWLVCRLQNCLRMFGFLRNSGCLSNWLCCKTK